MVKKDPEENYKANRAATGGNSDERIEPLFSFVAEWYVIGEYKLAHMSGHSVSGRLGDIRGRPNEEDLRDVAERVKGCFGCSSRLSGNCAFKPSD